MYWINDLKLRTEILLALKLVWGWCWEYYDWCNNVYSIPVAIMSQQYSLGNWSLLLGYIQIGLSYTINSTSLVTDDILQCQLLVQRQRGPDLNWPKQIKKHCFLVGEKHLLSCQPEEKKVAYCHIILILTAILYLWWFI